MKTIHTNDTNAASVSPLTIWFWHPHGHPPTPNGTTDTRGSWDLIVLRLFVNVQKNEPTLGWLLEIILPSARSMKGALWTVTLEMVRLCTTCPNKVSLTWNKYTIQPLYSWICSDSMVKWVGEKRWHQGSTGFSDTIYCIWWCFYRDFDCTGVCGWAKTNLGK